MIEKHLDKIKISFTISQEVYERFRELCKEHGMKMSPRLELLMKEDIEYLVDLGGFKNEKQNK